MELASSAEELPGLLNPMCYEQHVLWEQYCEMMQSLALGISTRQSEIDLPRQNPGFVTLGFIDLEKIVSRPPTF
jgi:hypothetical protein